MCNISLINFHIWRSISFYLMIRLHWHNMCHIRINFPFQRYYFIIIINRSLYRNKELANDASAVIAMTEEEKQRLSELLSDLDTVTEEHTVEVHLVQFVTVTDRTMESLCDPVTELILS